MNTETGISLQLSRVIKASRERVFRAWTDPEEMKRWACPEGATVLDAEADLTVGGRYTIKMNSDKGQHTAIGEYLEIDAPRRLVYTWDWEQEDMRVGNTRVTVEFNDLDGSTEVVLTHDRFPAAEARDGHEAGWNSSLDKFERLFA